MTRTTLLQIIFFIAAAIALSVPPGVEAQDDPVQAYLSAVEILDSDSESAFETLASLAQAGGPIADLASYRLVLRAEKETDAATLAKLALTHVQHFRYSRSTGEVRLILAEALNELGEGAQAETQVRTFQAEFPEREQARAYALLGIALATQEKYDEAQRALSDASHLHYDARWTREAGEVSRRLAIDEKAPRKAPSKERLVDEIDRNWERRWYITCQRLCEKYVRLFGGKDAWRYQLKAVDCLLERRKRSNARKYLANLAKSFSKSRHAQAGLSVRWARAERGKGFRGKPHSSHWEALSKYPGTEGADEARYWIGYNHFDGYRYEPAIEMLEKFIEKKTVPVCRPEALWMAGFAHFLTKNFPAAVDHFSTFAKEFPKNRNLDRAIYWRGRALAHLGETEKAKDDYVWLSKRFFGTYYGLAAQLHLETAGAPHFSTMENQAEQIPWEFLLPLMPLPRLDRSWAQENGGGRTFDDGAKRALEFFSTGGDVRMQQPVANFLAFYQAGHQDQARKETAFLKEYRLDVPYAGYLVGMMFSLLGEPLSAIIAADNTARTIRSGELFDPHRLNARRQFPLLHFDLIRAASETHETDPWLIIGLVKQESAFQTEATSWVRAAGLFQVMPATGKWIARKRGIKKFKTKDLYDPETSADFGVWYFKRLLTNTENDVPKSLAGYNAGGLRAERWWNANVGRPYDEMIELIGFSETRNYVKLILRNWEMYQRLYLDPLTPEKPRETVFTILYKTVPPPLEEANSDK
jgi:soluble lytic murein transglycosylase-like protein